MRHDEDVVFERSAARVRASLPPHELDDATARGASMDNRAVIAFALGALDVLAD